MRTNQDILNRMAMMGVHQEKPSTDEQIRKTAYEQGREAGIGIGRSLAEYAQVIGKTFEEVLKEFKERG